MFNQKIKKKMEILETIAMVVVLVSLGLLVAHYRKKYFYLVKKIITKKDKSIQELLTILESHGEHIVDGDADAPKMAGFTVIFHRKMGLWRVNPKLYVSAKQKNTKVIDGRVLYNDIKELKNLNINVLFYLLKYKELIPNYWPNRVYFWGTISRCNADGQLYVYCLLKTSGHWAYVCEALSSMIGSDEPAAVE